MTRRRIARFLRHLADVLAPEPRELESVRILAPRHGDGPNMQLAREIEARVVLAHALRRYSPKEVFEA